MYARLANKAAKALVLEVTGKKAVSVTRGKGTAYGWLHITAEATREQRAQIEGRLVEVGACFTYTPDMSPAPVACVLWKRS